MNYELAVRLEPERRFLHVEGKVSGMRGGPLYLNENLTLLGAWAGGREIGWRLERDKPHPAFDTVSRPVLFETGETEIIFSYEGNFPELINDINELSAGTVELASYAGWYPKPREFGELFDFSLSLSLPEGYELVSNGEIRPDGTIRSRAPEDDIVLFASRNVARYNCETGGLRFTALCPEPLLPRMERCAADLSRAYRLFTDWYGQLDNRGEGRELVSVFRPRGGWGYRRGNVTLMAGDRPSGPEEYKGDFHELAHSWWGIAGLADDWINEGGAEYSAFAAARELYGPLSAGRYAKEYREQIAKAETRCPVVRTPVDSPDRYRNLYQKTTVLFLLAEQRFGREAVRGHLRRLYQACRGGRDATTAGFLACCSPEMRAFYEPYLFAEGWEGMDWKC